MTNRCSVALCYYPVRTPGREASLAMVELDWGISLEKQVARSDRPGRSRVISAMRAMTEEKETLLIETEKVSRSKKLELKLSNYRSAE